MPVAVGEYKVVSSSGKMTAGKDSLDVMFGRFRLCFGQKLALGSAHS